MSSDYVGVEIFLKTLFLVGHILIAIMSMEAVEILYPGVGAALFLIISLGFYLVMSMIIQFFISCAKECVIG